MRTFYHIDLGDCSVKKQTLEGEDIVRAGRYLIAKTLVEKNVATVDPLSKDNPLIFSAGPFAGSNFSNANRLSVGCKSPLTGGIKEANSGGTFAFALGQLELAGLTLYNWKSVLTLPPNLWAWATSMQLPNYTKNMAKKSALGCVVRSVSTRVC